LIRTPVKEEKSEPKKSTHHPAVNAARQKGIDVTGPFAADTLFYHAYRGEYDAVVAMYHDRDWFPEMIGFERGVNGTLVCPHSNLARPWYGVRYRRERLR